MGEQEIRPTEDWQIAAKRRALRMATFDRAHLPKHLPGTPQAERLIRTEGAAHVFRDQATVDDVTRAILDHGEYIGMKGAHERWGLRFDEPIGFRVAADGTTIPLHYGELKLNPTTGRYHVIPRTGPSKL